MADQLCNVVCPYCGFDAVLEDSKVIYGRSYGMIWICRPCRAWVGVHKNSENYRPLGTLANDELRVARQAAHKAFDPFWQTLVEQGMGKGKARAQAYERLAAGLMIDKARCHIAEFDLETCQRVVAICAKWKEATA